VKLRHEWLGEMEIPTRPRRIVSLAPSVTDTLFALGVGDLVVGRSAFCWRPSAAESLPVVGSYTKIRWSLLEELEPDLVFTTTAVQHQATLDLKARGYAVWPVPLPQSPWGIIENVTLVGALLGVEAEGVAAGLARRYLDLAGSFPGLRVYFEFDLGGPITIGRGSYLHSALAHLGLKNVFGEHPEAYFAPPIERVPDLDPQLVIFEPKRIRNRKAQAEGARRLLLERGWDYPAVITEGDALAHFGPTFFTYLEQLVSQLAQVISGNRYT